MRRRRTDCRQRSHYWKRGAYVNGHLEGGNARLATYRDSERPTFVGAEFASTVDRMPSLTTYLPELKNYLLNYPNASLPKADSFFYWQEAKFGLKPTIRINHLTIAEAATQMRAALSITKTVMEGSPRQ